MKEIKMWDVIPGPSNGSQPALEYYEPASPAKDAAVVIFPGGAYTHLAPHEGKGYATTAGDEGQRLEEADRQYPGLGCFQC